MKKRWLFLALALGVVASLASATPSQAGTIYITQAIFLNTSGKAANDFEAIFTGAGGSISNVTVFTPAGAGTVGSGGNIVRLQFSPALANFGVLDFQFQTTSSPIKFSSGSWTYENHNPKAAKPPVYIHTSQVVPEPTSMVLLAIGMTGFLALRRFFKRILFA